MFANFLRIIICCLPLMLGACSTDDLPKWFTGEPTQAEINAYKGPVTMPPELPKDAAWPNLADVPQRPVSKLTPVDRQNEIAGLEKENVEGQSDVAKFVKDTTSVAKAASVAKPVVKAKPKKKKKKKVAPKPVAEPAPVPKADEIFTPEPGAAQ